MKFCPNFLPFLEPKLEDFLSLLHIKYCPIFLPFFGAKIGGPSIPYYIWNLAQFFCLFWSQKWRTWNSWLPHILPKFYAFFGAKSRGLSIPYYIWSFALIFCLFWSQKLEDFLFLTTYEILPIFLPFLEPKLEDFLSLTKYEACILYVHSLSFDDFFPWLDKNAQNGPVISILPLSLLILLPLSVFLINIYRYQ